MANYARVVWRSAALCSVVAAVMIAICAAVAGTKGVYGSLVGIGVVTAFFGISVLAIGRAAKVSPTVMMVVALATYVVKIIAFMIVLALLQNVTVFNGRSLGLTAFVLIITWCAAQVVIMMRAKMPYVTPEEMK
jgi:ATP synthase protein I